MVQINIQKTQKYVLLFFVTVTPTSNLIPIDFPSLSFAFDSIDAVDVK